MAALRRRYILAMMSQICTSIGRSIKDSDVTSANLIISCACAGRDSLINELLQKSISLALENEQFIFITRRYFAR